MEFNAIQQYRPVPERFPFAQQQTTRNAAQTMHSSSGNFVVQTQSAQPSLRTPQPQSYPTWSPLNAAPKSFPMQRRNTLTAEAPRPQLPDQPASSRPLSMTAQTIRNLGVQNPRLCTDFGNLQQQPSSSMDSNAWNQQKTCTDLDYSGFESEMTDFTTELMGTDENAPIIDLRQYNGFEQENGQDAFRSNLSRRMSESSFSMSSTGPMAEVGTIEDYSTSEISYASDCDWSALEPNPQLLSSPMASPRNSYHEALRSGSRSRASPVPHNNVRTSPYTMETNRNKRWSTGTYNSLTTPPNPINRFDNRYSFYGSPLNPNHAFGLSPDFSLLQASNPLFPTPTLPSSGPTLFSSADHQFPEAPRPLPSQGLFRLLQSNVDRLPGCSSHFADLSDPPDLYASLNEEPSNPPESDMNPSDPDLVPHEQDLRFTGDLYTPRWVRGHGNKREGWCGLCKPGRWLVLKNSAFWYDKSFTHGVSAATGAAFQGPQGTRRTEGNLDVWEGLCGSCGDWIALVSSKKKGTTWFRHAYKCHTHPKAKDGPKRRRETSGNLRARAASTSSNLPQSASTSASSSTIPTTQSSSESLLGKANRAPSNDSNPTLGAVKSESSGSESTPISTPQVQSTPMSMDTTNSSTPSTSAQSQYESLDVPSLQVHQPQPQSHAQHVDPIKLEQDPSPEKHLLQFEMSQPSVQHASTPAPIPPRSDSLVHFHDHQHQGTHAHYNPTTTAAPLRLNTMASHQYPTTAMPMSMSGIEEHPPHDLFASNGARLMPGGLNIETRTMNPLDSVANMF